VYLRPEIFGKLTELVGVYESKIIAPIADIGMRYCETDEHLRQPPRERADFAPASVGLRWGHAWGNAWFCGEVEVPAEAAANRFICAPAPAGWRLFCGLTASRAGCSRIGRTRHRRSRTTITRCG